ncbi:MAG: hypothetical protein PHH85_14185, partial [Candidatus Methanoperedens sp.]|nr:hypothetical protein [Candidatus Methanoperedens sp.]
NIPKTSSMHMGVRYPERFMLRNPGHGSYGIISTYPLNITISYAGTNRNFISMGIVYQMQGLSEFPKLVYENGIVVKDYGSWGYTEDDNRLTTNDSIFVPLLLGIEPISSIEIKTFNIFPIPQQYYYSSTFSSVNLTIETRYPEIWANMTNTSKPSGSIFTVDQMNRSIKIFDVYGFNVNSLTLPNTENLPSNKVYVGMVPFGNFYSGGSMGLGGSGNCGSPGKDVSNKDQGCIDIIGSSSARQFVIQNIAMVENSSESLRFSVKDSRDNEWKVDVKPSSGANGNITSISVDQKKPSGTCAGVFEPPDRLNLTQCYISLNPQITTPNVLAVEKIHSDILHVNFLIT